MAAKESRLKNVCELLAPSADATNAERPLQGIDGPRRAKIVAKYLGLSMHQSHHVLQLIAKPKSSARLIETATTPGSTARV